MKSTNEYIKQKWGDRPQIDLAKAIAKELGEKNYEQYKGYVNKWFKSNQEPGKHYLLLLSKILNVSVESILRGEDTINEYGDRPTAYSAAKSGDPNIIDRLFGNSEADVRLHTTDEYGKSFIDYVIEFNNYSAFRTAIEKGYEYHGNINDYSTNLSLDFGNSKTDMVLTKMIIENDDVYMFIKAFGKFDRENESPVSVFYNHSSLLREKDIILCILKTKEILNWLVQKRVFSESERKEFSGTWELIEDYQYLENTVYAIPTVLFGFHYLLNLCIEEDFYDVLEVLLEYGEQIVNDINDIIKDYRCEFEVTKDFYFNAMIIQLKSRHRVCPLGFVPYVESCDKIKNDTLRRKAESINGQIDSLRKNNEKTKS